MTVRHLLEIDDLTPAELARVLDLAEAEPPRPLEGRGVALLFEKPSARTRNAIEMAVVQLGGHPVSMRGEEVGIGRRESAEDLARVLSGYHAVIGARVLSHATLERMAGVAPVPVINLLSDLSHPTQALADLLTLRQHFERRQADAAARRRRAKAAPMPGPAPGRTLGGALAGRQLAWVGDANNVFRSLSLAAAMAGMGMRAACPAGFGPDGAHLARVRALGGEVAVTDSPQEAVAGADVVSTDVWTSMGQEDEDHIRRRSFAGFIVDESLMAAAAADAVFLHCLPAHRGVEVAAAVVDGSQSLVWAQATNRMHAVRGLLCFVLGAGMP